MVAPGLRGLLDLLLGVRDDHVASFGDVGAFDGDELLGPQRPRIDDGPASFAAVVVEDVTDRADLLVVIVEDGVPGQVGRLTGLSIWSGSSGNVDIEDLLSARRCSRTRPAYSSHICHISHVRRERRCSHRYSASVTTTDLLDQLTLDQKVELLAGADTWHTAEFDEPPVPAIRMSDGPAGVRGTSWTGAASASFPCGAALGATWDRALVEQVGRALGREAHAKSAHVLLAPTVNLHRTPIGGRNFECPSEDPVLTAEVAVAYVRGLQHERVAACIKHFVGNDTEFERMTISSEIDERTLRELYFVPFEAAVRRADVRSIMTGYNKLNGTFCSEHRWLLADVLRGEWGFDGAVVSDWFGMPQRRPPRCWPGSTWRCPALPASAASTSLDAIAAGEVSEDDVDRAVARLLALGGVDGCRVDRHSRGDGRRPGDACGHPPRRHPRHRAVEERAGPAATVAGDAPRGPDRPVRPLRPAAGWRQRAGAGRPRPWSARGAGGAGARRHVRAGRFDRQVPTDGARRLHRIVHRRLRCGRPRCRPAASPGIGTSRRPRASTPSSSPPASTGRSCPRRRGRGSSACAPSDRRRCASTAM